MSMDSRVEPQPSFSGGLPPGQPRGGVAPKNLCLARQTIAVVVSSIVSSIGTPVTARRTAKAW